jgi:formamidopyrimidine-DNA glycosylase
MPELPEVETVARALRRAGLEGRVITGCACRCAKLRRPLPAAELQKSVGAAILAIERRAKYLLFRLTDGRILLLHLGMTGTLRLDEPKTPAGRHDHFDLLFDDGRILRLRDPRKFGLVALSRPAADGLVPELANLAPEPLSDAFSGEYLYRVSRGRKTPIKVFIMDQRRVVGVGNIYASESLFRAGIRPSLPAGRLSRPRCRKLAAAIREILEAAIAAGGTTISDFHGLDGSEGAFVRTLKVYGRAGEPCPDCGRPLKKSVLGGRSTFFCSGCQR